jgi:hypothetical protein
MWGKAIGTNEIKNAQSTLANFQRARQLGLKL